MASRFGEAPVEAREAVGVGGDDPPGSIAGEDDGDGVGFGAVGGEAGEHVAVAGEDFLEAGVDGGAVVFDIDKERGRGAIAEEAAAVGADAFAERVEVEFLEVRSGLTLARLWATRSLPLTR